MTTLSQFHCARGEGKSKEIWQHGKTSSTLPNGIKGGEEGGGVNFFWIRHNFLFSFFYLNLTKCPEEAVSEQKTTKLFSAGLTQHFNTSCALCSAVERQRKAMGTRMTVGHSVWVQTCLPLFVFPLSILLSWEHMHTHRNPQREKLGKIHAVVENKWHQQRRRWLQSKIQTTSGLA